MSAYSTSSSPVVKSSILKKQQGDDEKQQPQQQQQQQQEEAVGDTSVGLKKVWFDSVNIRYHTMILGDHPAVSEGAPITIGWRAHNEELLDLDCYEATKPKKNYNKKKIPVGDRAAILFKRGYSIDDLAKSTQAAQEIQRQRAQSSSESQKWDRINLIAEISGKMFRKLRRVGPPLVPISYFTTQKDDGLFPLEGDASYPGYDRECKGIVHRVAAL